MNIRIFKSADDIGKAAAMIFASQVLQKPNCLLGFATGSTPLPTYRQMIELYKSGIADYSSVTTFNLDEYIGFDGNHPQSYRYFMMQNLFNHINVKQENINVVSGIPNSNFEEVGKAYDQKIESLGGIDVQLLGIGHNGHVAFNEPSDHFSNGTHQVFLTNSTIEANKRFFEHADDVPRSAMSMGIASIMKARNIVLVSAGSDKATAIQAAVEGPITPECPASILQLHPSVTFMLDEGAASKL